MYSCQVEKISQVQKTVKKKKKKKKKIKNVEIELKTSLKNI